MGGGGSGTVSDEAKGGVHRTPEHYKRDCRNSIAISDAISDYDIGNSKYVYGGSEIAHRKSEIASEIACYFCS